MADEAVAVMDAPAEAVPATAPAAAPDAGIMSMLSTLADLDKPAEAAPAVETPAEPEPTAATPEPVAEPVQDEWKPPTREEYEALIAEREALKNPPATETPAEPAAETPAFSPTVEPFKLTEDESIELTEEAAGVIESALTRMRQEIRDEILAVAEALETKVPVLVAGNVVEHMPLGLAANEFRKNYADIANDKKQFFALLAEVRKENPGANEHVMLEKMSMRAAASLKAIADKQARADEIIAAVDKGNGAVVNGGTPLGAKAGGVSGVAGEAPAATIQDPFLKMAQEMADYYKGKAHI